jgi:hypothetical protein
MNIRDKLECLALADFFQPSQLFADMARARPSEVPSPFLRRLLVLSTNIRLDWKILSLSGTNTLAYYEHS